MDNNYSNNYSSNNQQSPNPQPSSMPPSYSPTHSKNKNNKTKTTALIVILLIAIIGLVAYSVLQQQKKNDLQKKVNSQVEQINKLKEVNSNQKQEPVKDEKNNDSTTKNDEIDLIPVMSNMNHGNNEVMVEAMYRQSANITSLWVEFGNAVDKINNSTNKITEGLGMGSADTVFAKGRNFVIKTNDANPADNYFYRVAAIIDGQTVYSDIAGFTVSK